MLNLLKSLRYFVFVVFVICNAIITSVAVWNLSIVESIAGTLYTVTAKQIDSYLIFVGAAGLLLIFPIIFLELYGKNTFLGRVWFELLWVGLFWLMELVGAAVLTAQSSSQNCDPSAGDSPSSASPSSSTESPCASSQVLQAFTWVVAILLLGYFTLLSILTFVKRVDDPTIWHCSVRRFPVMSAQNSLKSPPTSPAEARFRAQSPPIIAAPRPRYHIAALRDAFLSYRSGLSLEYEIEHYQAQAADEVQNPHPTDMSENNRTSRTSWIPAPAPAQQQPLQPLRQNTIPPVQSTPFYHSVVRTAIDERTAGQPRPPQPAQLSSEVRRLPPSPPPLGDWPRLDATSRPRTKRKPLPRPAPEPELQGRPEPEPQAPPPPQNQRRRSTALPRPQPPREIQTSQSQSQSQWQATSPVQQTPQPQPSATRQTPQPLATRQASHRKPLPSVQPQAAPAAQSYTLDAPALTAALQPLASPPANSTWRSRPGGPRRPSGSIDRPPGLDLSQISSYRSPGFSQ